MFYLGIDITKQKHYGAIIDLSGKVAVKPFPIFNSKKSGQFLLEQLQLISNQLEECDKEIDSLMKKLNSPITSIPGIGPVLGATISRRNRIYCSFL